MREQIQEILNSIKQKKSDERVNVFDIRILSLDNELLSLDGRVLEESDLELIREKVQPLFKRLKIETGSVEVLRKSSNPILTVGTNLTSLHTSPSFLAEMSSQLVYGEKLEILVEQGRWVFTRQLDGYLAWTYKPYLTETSPTPATHIILSPSTNLYSEPDTGANILTRGYCGTYVAALSEQNGWVRISANQEGWVKAADLRSLAAFPQTAAAKRDQMMKDAHRLVGIPYLWGGSAGNGIDCSGFARLLHRFVGIALPRDADMQATLAKKVQPPFLPGDLLFFGEGDSDRRITHVGVSIGGWKIIHASRARNGVYVDDVQEKENLRSTFSHAGRFLAD